MSDRSTLVRRTVVSSDRGSLGVVSSSIDPSARWPPNFPPLLRTTDAWPDPRRTHHRTPGRFVVRTAGVGTEAGMSSALDIEIRPFTLAVPEAEVTELRRRVMATRWPSAE